VFHKYLRNKKDGENTAEYFFPVCRKRITAVTVIKVFSFIPNADPKGERAFRRRYPFAPFSNGIPFDSSNGGTLVRPLLLKQVYFNIRSDKNQGIYFNSIEIFSDL
jgi:hypothetical protein